MTKRIVILMGLQGSGKTTFYHRHLSTEYLHVNLDTLNTRHKEKLFVTACLQSGKNFAVDNTNPTKTDRARYIIPAKEAGYQVIGYFMESKLKDCIARNALRKGNAHIPDTAIACTSNKLEMPSLSEGFDALYFVKNDGHMMTISEWRESV